MAISRTLKTASIQQDELSEFIDQVVVQKNLDKVT
jgi:hypothetical protein